MVRKKKWEVLPSLVNHKLSGIRLIPHGVKVERNRQPSLLGENRFSKISAETLPLTHVESMQYGHALEQLLREIVFEDPKLGPVYIIKANLSYRFYHIGLRPPNAPKLGLVFPGIHIGEHRFALPLTLPMSWKKMSPLFCNTIEIIANVENASL